MFVTIQLKAIMVYFNISLVTLFFIFKEIQGHGMMLEPPNRSSLWRFNPTAPVNYDDNQNFCGGFSVQWGTFGGKCGVCGDIFSAPHPQPNENTGKYGRGKVVRTYHSGSVIDIAVNLTTNHLGYFQYSMCVLTNPNAPESGEDCFKPVTLPDGSTEVPISKEMKHVTHKLQLPEGLKCDRCVLRWQYNAGNNWGKCRDGSYSEGCGPQETFRSCADIAII